MFLDSDESSESSETLLERKKIDEVFLKDHITPSGFAVSGYVCLEAISAMIPLIFPPLKWFFVLCSVDPGLTVVTEYGQYSLRFFLSYEPIHPSVRTLDHQCFCALQKMSPEHRTKVPIHADLNVYFFS